MVLRLLASFQRFLLALWPRSIGNQCLLMMQLGLLVRWLWPQHVAVLKPLAKVFLQASKKVVMPFLICELVVGFGSLRPGMLRTFLRSDLLVLLGLRTAGGLVVLQEVPVEGLTTLEKCLDSGCFDLVVRGIQTAPPTNHAPSALSGLTTGVFSAGGA